MVVKIPAADLKKVVKKLGAVSPGSIKIDFATGNLQALDGDLGVQVFSSPFRVSDFAVFVNSKLLGATVAKLSKDVNLFCEPGGPLVITSAKLEARVPLVKESAWPAPVEWSGDVLYSLPLEPLSDLLKFASTVTSDSATLDHTGSIRLGVNKETIRADATDNFRVATATTKRDAGLGDQLHILIPGRISRAIQDLEGNEVLVSQTDVALFFESGNTTILSRKISKKFPPIENVIPKSFKLEVKLPVEALLDSLQRVAPAIDSEAPVPRVAAVFDGTVLRLQTGGSLTGQAIDEVEMEPIVPDVFDEPYRLAIHANHKFLCQYLTSVKGSVIIKANEPGKPLMLESGNKQILIAGLKV